MPSVRVRAAQEGGVFFIPGDIGSALAHRGRVAKDLGDGVTPCSSFCASRRLSTSMDCSIVTARRTSTSMRSMRQNASAMLIGDQPFRRVITPRPNRTGLTCEKRRTPPSRLAVPRPDCHRWRAVAPMPARSCLLQECPRTPAHPSGTAHDTALDFVQRRLGDVRDTPFDNVTICR